MTTHSPLPPLVRPRELAALLGLDRSTISRLVCAGRPVAGLEAIWLTEHTYAFRRPEVERVLGVASDSRDVA